MIVYPHSKINLGLHILNKREDGFHDIETLFYPLKLSDALEIIPASDGKTEFSASGIPIPGNAEGNLCLQAWELLHKHHNIPRVKIHLHKVIPIGAGLGGGSSDAAFTLKLINDLFEADIPGELLHKYAKQLGSDCSFFLNGQPALASGKGEILKPFDVSLKGYYLILLSPLIHVSTAEAYAEIKPSMPETRLENVLTLPVKKWKGLLVNDFEMSVFMKHPEIKEIKTQLYGSGALYACMSGSGASVFGIFAQKPAGDVNDLFKDYLVWEEEIS
ncbi:MAG: 4-(cytidine 5'-diphospho)-2-C-methyl-D-erythritol kinase [Bacteroidales bacterium]